MAAANRQLPVNPNTRTYTIAGTITPNNPLVRGPDDGVVGTWSAELPPDSTSLGRMRHFHTSQLSYRDVFDMAYAGLAGKTLGEPTPVPSVAAMPPVQPTLLASGELDAGETAVFDVPLLGRGAWLGVCWTDGEPALALIAPDGRRYDETSSDVQRHESKEPPTQMRLLRPQMQQQGIWQLEITARKGPLRLIALAAEGGPRLEPVSPPPEAVPTPGEKVRVAARLTGGIASAKLQATAFLRRPEGDLQTLDLEPLPPAPGAGDPVFAADLLTDGLSPGFYPVVFAVSSDDPLLPLSRYALGGLTLRDPNEEPPVHPNGPTDTAPQDLPALIGAPTFRSEGGDLLVYLPLRLPRADTYVINARLDGSGWAAAWLNLPAGETTPTLRFAAVGVAPLRDLSVYPVRRPEQALLRSEPQAIPR